MSIINKNSLWTRGGVNCKIALVTLACLAWAGRTVRAAESAALTVKACRHVSATVCEAELECAPAAADRAVIVAWGGTDGGATPAGWEHSAYAGGYVPALAARARVTLPAGAAAAERMRVFLAADGTAAEYVEFNGTQYIETDYVPGTADSGFEVDFQMNSIEPVQQRVIGLNKGLNVHIYVNGNRYWSWTYCDNGNWTTTAKDVTLERTQIILDAYNDLYSLTIGGTPVYTCRVSEKESASLRTRTATAPILIGADAAFVDKYANMKFYSLVCNRRGVTERRFVGYVKHGRACVRDTVTGRCFRPACGDELTAVPKADTAVSAASGAVTPAAALGVFAVADLAVGRDDPGLATLSCGASGAAREVWYAWGDTDAGTSFAAWPHNERLGTLAAGAVSARYRLPQGSKGAKAGRFFLLAPGGDYPCAYIVALGRQAIDTGFRATPQTAVTVDFHLREANARQMRVFGVNTNPFTFACYFNGGGLWAWAARDDDGNWRSTGKAPENIRYTVSLDLPNDRFTLVSGGRTLVTETVSSQVPEAKRTKTSTVPLQLFAAINSDGKRTSFMLGELYGATVSEGGVPQRAYVPCVSGGVAGLRDTLTGTFYGNAEEGQPPFLAGGRADAPAALAVTDAVEPAAAVTDDIMAEADFWLRPDDVNGDGILDHNEMRDCLGRRNLAFRSNGAAGSKTTHSNETVRLPGRDVAREMATLHLAQTVVLTNDTQGYVSPCCLRADNTFAEYDTYFTLLLRIRPDFTRPAYKSYQFFLNAGHNGSAKKGFMLALGGDGAHSRHLVFFAGGGSFNTGSRFSETTVTNGWTDVALVCDGQKLSVYVARDWPQTDDRGGSAYITEVLPPDYSILPDHFLTLGSQAETGGPRPYPMGENDNSVKAFAGSIQQVVAWRRPLSRQELGRAVGWPRSELWRAGVEDGGTREFAAPADAAEPGTIDVDVEKWPLADGLAAGGSVTFKFPLTDQYETRLPQFLRWKSLGGVEGARLRLSVNGRTVGEHAVRPDGWTAWYVPADLLAAGTNTCTLTRADTRGGRLVPDTVVFGGGWQVGKPDNSTKEFGHESYGWNSYSVESGALREVQRVIFCSKNAARTNTWFHFRTPRDLAGTCGWIFRMGVVPTGNNQTMNIDLDGRRLFSAVATRDKVYEVQFGADELAAGDHVFTFHNQDISTNARYISIDYVSLEPVRPVDGTLLLLR